MTFLFAFNNTIVAAIQSSILESLGHVNLLAWIGVSFSLGSTCVLAWSKAYGVFNIKWLFISHVILFEVGSVVCDAAPNMPAVILGRVIAGVGGSGIFVTELIAGTGSTAFKSLSPEVADKVVKALTRSMRNVWIWFLSGGALSFVLRS